jgi:kojibiose phosphorylase
LHASVWKRKWLLSDIMVEGDEELQRTLRFSIYHLIRSNAEDDPRVAICAKGYAGEAYFGRYFWDTEIYMLPFFIYTNPKAAKNLLMFRFNSLKGAKENARKYGYKGARFAWESSVGGEENCCLWQYSDNEIHITADIIYALCNYYEVTGDYKFMLDYGIDIMIETSRYWAQRVDKNLKGGYDLINVMGPDEYKAFSRNNAFTNKMVSYSLEKTVEFLCTIKSHEYESIVKRVGISIQEMELFKTVAEKLVIPWDREKNLILQSEDFYGYADIDKNTLWNDRRKAFGHYISQERLYRSKALKQADALALIHLFPNYFTKEQMKIAYEYYEPITTHDSSLSAVVHALIAVWLRKEDEVRKFLKKALEIDTNPYEKGGAEEGIHIANCGGIWQLMVFGFGGLQIAGGQEEIRLQPFLLENWKKLEFSVQRLEKNYKVTISKDGYTITEK